METMTKLVLNYHNNPNIANPVMLSRITLHISKSSSISPRKGGSLKDPTGNYHPLIQENYLKLVSCILDYLAENLRTEAISRRALGLIENSQRFTNH